MTTTTDPHAPEPELEGVPHEPIEADDSLRHELLSLRPHDHVEAERLESALGERMFGISSATTKIGRFDIRGRLASGGMGVVYSAYDPQLQRHVALKLLRDSSRVGRVEHERLLREALALARIKHPNVVTVHEVGQLDDQVFLVMELVEGQSLHTWANAASHGFAEVLALYLQAGRGLAAAHAAGLVHRDFKPHNAVVGTDGRVRVVDFGLACDDGPGDTEQASATRESSGVTARPSSTSPSLEGPSSGSLTRTDTLLGTPAYMSPEQCERRPVDSASDQWSFCVALHEALVGARPFEGDTAEELAAHIRAGTICEPPRDARVPAWLLATLRRGMSVDPHARFGSMDELLAALERDPWRNRRRWLAGAAVTALTGAVVVMLAQRPASEPCAGSRTALADAWGPGHRTEVAAHLASLAAPASTDPLLAAIDGYTTRWQEMHEAACRAGHDGVHSEAMLDKRMVCLAERRAALEGAIEVLGTTAADALETVAPAIQDLPSVQRCGDLVVLDAEVPLPEDPAVRAVVAEARAQLSRATLLADVGRFEDALAIAVQWEARADALAQRSLVARARLARGRVEMETDATDASRPAATLTTAFYDAIASDDRELAVEALVLGLYLDAIRPGATAPDDDYRMVYALLEPLPARSPVRALFLNNAGAIAVARGDFETAGDDFERALVALEAAPDAPPIQLADTRFNVALNTKDAERQRAAFEAVAAGYEQLLGPSHPRTLLTRLLLARIELDPRVALPRYEALCQSYAHHHPEDLAKCLYDQGLRHIEANELEAAAGVLERAASLLQAPLAALPPRSQAALRVRQALARGQALASRGQHAEVVTELRAVLERLAAETPSTWMRGWTAELTVVLGEALVAVARPTEAIETLTPVVESLTELATQRVDAGLERTLVRARLALAQAHVDAHAGTIVPASTAATVHGLLAAVEPRIRAAGLTRQRAALRMLSQRVLAR